MSRHRAAVLALASIASPGQAEEGLPRGPGALGVERIEEPSPPSGKPPIAPLKQRLPPIVPDHEQRLPYRLRVYVKQIRLSGNSLFSTEELSKITSHYQDRFVTTDELQELRRRLTLHYVEQGYINSGAVLPDQKVVDGVIQMRIVEGKLSDVEVTGNKRLRRTYIKNRLLGSPDEFLRIEPLQQRLQLLQQSVLIQGIRGDLLPGSKPGEAKLNVEIKEENPWLLAFAASNNRAASVGAEHGELFAGHQNLTGWGDSLRFRLSLTEGAGGGGIYYQVPLNARETSLFLGVDHSDSSVVEQPFSSLDIDSELDTYRIGLSHPLLRTPWREFSLGIALDKRHSLTKLGGSPFSFSAGVQKGESDVTVIRLSQDWLQRGGKQAIAARSTFSLGIDALDATINDTGPDGRFTAWLGQFQWARRFEQTGHEAIFRTDLQLSADPLLPLEQCAIGGAQSVRGYRVNQLVRDNCLVASLEYRLSLFQLPLFYVSQAPQDGDVQLAVFADYGKAWNKGRSSVNADAIYSAGLGLRWNPGTDIHAEIYWGYAFKEFHYEERDLQDDGISFRVYWKAF